MRSARIFTIFILVILLSGCKFKVVGKFDDYNEAFIGTVESNVLNGDASFHAEAVKSKISCDGAGSTVFAPPTLDCSGQKGSGEATCTDGRIIQFTWLTRSCTSGIGKGVTKDGINFHFAFGQTEEQANTELKKILAESQDKPEMPVYRPEEVRKEKGFATGSGFFVSSEGALVTNYHVINGAKEITVIDTISKKEFKATVLKSDPTNDVAILKIDAVTEPVTLSERFSTMKGEEVFTLGYPLIQIQGQEQKATFGRVNSLSGIGDDIRYAQIDVPIQPGNSGGPLFNNRGEVVGVTSATLNQMVTLKASGALPQNVNFAVKVDYVLPLLRMVLKDQEFKTSIGSPIQEIPKLVSKLESTVVLIVAK